MVSHSFTEIMVQWIPDTALLAKEQDHINVWVMLLLIWCRTHRTIPRESIMWEWPSPIHRQQYTVLCRYIVHHLADRSVCRNQLYRRMQHITLYHHQLRREVTITDRCRRTSWNMASNKNRIIGNNRWPQSRFFKTWTSLDVFQQQSSGSRPEQESRPAAQAQALQRPSLSDWTEEWPASHYVFYTHAILDRANIYPRAFPAKYPSGKSWKVWSWETSYAALT